MRQIKLDQFPAIPHLAGPGYCQNQEYHLQCRILRAALKCGVCNVVALLLGSVHYGERKEVEDASPHLRTNNEMAGWHYQGNGQEAGQSPGDAEGQKGLVCCSPWGHKESDTTAD